MMPKWPLCCVRLVFGRPTLEYSRLLLSTNLAKLYYSSRGIRQLCGDDVVSGMLENHQARPKMESH
jgi:hypothetical protein